MAIFDIFVDALIAMKRDIDADVKPAVNVLRKKCEELFEGAKEYSTKVSS